MTQMPPPDPAPTPIPADSAHTPPDGEESQEVEFAPYLPSTEPTEPSRTKWYLLGGCVLLMVAGFLFWDGGPDPAEAKPKTPAEMSASELAADGSMLAANELLRRSREGTPARQAAARKVLAHPTNPRLKRNLCMSMALQQQKRAYENNLRVRREMEGAERGPAGEEYITYSPR